MGLWQPKAEISGNGRLPHLIGDFESCIDVSGGMIPIATGGTLFRGNYHP
jgi:hypothetical protein